MHRIGPKSFYPARVALNQLPSPLNVPPGFNSASLHIVLGSTGFTLGCRYYLDKSRLQGWKRLGRSRCAYRGFRCISRGFLPLSAIFAACNQNGHGGNDYPHHQQGGSQLLGRVLLFGNSLKHRIFHAAFLCVKKHPYSKAQPQQKEPHRFLLINGAVLMAQP